MSSELGRVTRHRVSVFVTLALLVPSCVPVDDTMGEELATDSARVLTGKVVDWQTGAGLPDVAVMTYEGGATTDSAGWFRIAGLESDMQWVTARHPDYISHRSAVLVSPTEPSRLDIFLARSAHMVDCPLAGEWDVELIVDRVGPGPQPRLRSIKGPITLENGRYQEPPLRADFICEVRGEHGLPVSYLRPRGHDLDTAQSWLRTSATLSSDSAVTVKTAAEVSDDGVGLAGTLDGDSIVGQWLLHSFAPNVSGHFIMRRKDGRPD